LVSFFLDEMAVAHSWQTLLGGRASRMLPHPIHLPLGLPLHFVVESASGLPRSRPEPLSLLPATRSRFPTFKPRVHSRAPRSSICWSDQKRILCSSNGIDFRSAHRCSRKPFRSPRVAALWWPKAHDQIFRTCLQCADALLHCAICGATFTEARRPARLRCADSARSRREMSMEPCYPASESADA